MRLLLHLARSTRSRCSRCPMSSRRSHVDSFVTALIVALVLGLINTLIRPLLVMLTLPVTILTLGLFIFVINGLLFWAVGSFVPRLPRRRLLGGRVRRDRLQPDLVGAVGAACPKKAAQRESPADDRARTRCLSASSSSRRARRRASRSCARRAAQLAQLKPAFFSVTFGAGGSTREGTLETVLEIRGEGLAAAPHISCVGSTRESIRDVLAQYRGARHPPPRRAARRPAVGHASTPASSATRTSSSRSSARRPATGSTSTSPRIPNTTRRRARREDDLANFKRKVDAGANSAITQYFYNADAYFRFVDACDERRHRRSDRAGHHADRAASRSSRASPTRAARRSRAGSGASSKATATTPRRSARSASTSSPQLCADLLEGGAPGLHFYTLNQAALTTTIWQRLGL